MYRAHRVVLAFGSGYFHAKFSGNPELQDATIDIIEVSTFGHLLNFLYTSELDVSESQIPALAEAACFLDMMEAVNLSAKRATPAHVDVLPVPAETPDVQTSAGAQCSFCTRTFCYKKSLENHLARSHSAAGCQVEDEQNMASTSAVTTRRSARQRRTPAKFESESGHVLSGNSGLKTPKHDAAAAFEEEEESEEEQQYEQEEQSSKEGREETVEEEECEDGEKQEEERVSAEQTEAQEETEPTSSRAAEEHSQTTNVFPEGLAPVMIQSANKKTLKCPKCDKTFDRIGENYEGWGMDQWHAQHFLLSVYVLKSLLIVKFTHYQKSEVKF